jgi:hypothetical protein
VRTRSCGPWILAFSLAGCGPSRASPAPSADAGADAEAAVMTFARSACGTCVAHACSSATTACGADPDCASYLTCLDGCGLGPAGDVDTACEKACPRSPSSSGAQAEQALTQCRTSGAGATCAACANDAGSGDPILHQMCAPVMDPDACHQCSRNHCCVTDATCRASADCMAYKSCFKACGSGAWDDGGAYVAGPPDGGSCEEMCYQPNPNGLAAFSGWLACLSVYCADIGACGGQPQDSCAQCKNAMCGDQIAENEGTVDGFLAGGCISQCASTDVACVNACWTKYPNAKAADDALLLCVLQKCPGCT